MILSKISPHILPIMAAFILMATAELGDKTQLLTFSFATYCKLSTVLSSVLAATVVLNLLAVVLGKFITIYLPISAIKTGAGILFLVFGIWTLMANDGSEVKANQTAHSFWTIFGAFILAEIGDKTQLAVIALAARYNKPLHVWIGASLGMGFANIAGIIVGNRLGANLPAKTIKLAAGTLFVVFGVLTLGEVLLNSP